MTDCTNIDCTAGATTIGTYTPADSGDTITDNGIAAGTLTYYWDAWDFNLSVPGSGGTITINTEPETEEQRQAREERAQEYQRQQVELRREQEAAVKRAEELLKEHIGLEAFGRLHEVGYIELDSPRHKGRKYRVPKDFYKRIEVVDDQGKVVDKLCIGPAIGCPPCDVVLARLVLLESAEEYVLALANHTDLRGLCAGGIQLEDLVV